MFDPQYQFTLQAIEDMKTRERLETETKELRRCPGCGQKAGWKLSSGGVRCTNCGFFATHEKYRDGVVRITLSRQYDLYDERSDGEDG